MWSDSMIRERLGSDVRPIVYIPLERADFRPIGDSQIQPASLDVRLGPDFIRHPDGQPFSTDPRYPYVLSPGECVLATLVERVQLSRYEVARIEGKSSWARQFLTVHSAGFIDPGFHGDVTLELRNDGHIKLELHPGVTIAQISFQSLDAPAARPYGSDGLNSHYQGQKGVTPCYGRGGGS